MGALLDQSQGRDLAIRAADYAVGPVNDDGPGESLAASTIVITGLRPGDPVQVYATGEYHAAFGTGGVVASVASSPGPFPSGIVRWTCPDGCDELAMVQGAAGAASGGAFKG